MSEFIKRKIKNCTFDDINEYIMCKGVGKELAIPRMKTMPSSILMFHASWRDYINQAIMSNKAAEAQAYWQIATTNFEQYKDQLSDKVLNMEIDILVEIES